MTMNSPKVFGITEDRTVQKELNLKVTKEISGYKIISVFKGLPHL